MSDAVVDSPAPAEQLYGCVVTYSRGEKVIHASRGNYIATLKKAIDDSFTTVSYTHLTLPTIYSV